MSANKVSIIVVNLNGMEFLKDCLDSIHNLSYPDFETILVDNGSTDGSLAFIRECYPSVKLIENPENAGFAGANNQGLSISEGDYIATVNNDIFLDKDWLSEHVRVITKGKRTGMSASKIFYRESPGIIDCVGIEAARCGFAHNRGNGKKDCGRYDNEEEVFGPCAAAALYKREMIEEVGFFDEKFFSYYEDLDLAWRARSKGWVCLCSPRARAYHIHSATGGRELSQKIYYLHRNKWLTILKNWPVNLILKRFPIIMTYDFISIFYATAKLRDLTPIKARLSVLKEVTKMTKVTKMPKMSKLFWAVGCVLWVVGSKHKAQSPKS